MKEKIQAGFTRYSIQVETLLKEMAGKSDELLNRKPADGGWTAMQTLQHLVLVEENSLAYIRKKLSHNPVLEKGGLGAWCRSMLLRISLQSPIKFKAPKAAGIDRITETGTIAEVSSAWQKVQQEWRSFFEKMPEALLDKAAYKHPRAGRLNWLQMLDFFSAHLERHRRQIYRAIS